MRKLYQSYFKESFSIKDFFDFKSKKDIYNEINNDYISLEQYKQFHKFEKNIDQLQIKLVYMSSSEYIKLASKMIGSIDEYKVNQLYNDFLKHKNKVPIPILDYEGIQNGNFQDGRHRAVVADKLGIDKIPVIIAYKEIQNIPNELKRYL